MRIRLGLVIGIIGCLMLAGFGFALSQDESLEGQATTEVKDMPETQWVWGEVVNLDPQNKAILVKYLDYENDQEKEISIKTDDSTTFENFKSLDEIKPNDEVSIDYIVTSDGTNLAKNIGLEKPEAAPDEESQGEATPEVLQPVGPPTEE